MTTTLLCHFDGTNGSTSFTDSSAFSHTLTPTSVTVNTTSPKFGTGEGDFTASSAANIDTGNAAHFNFGGWPFTIEAWAYFTSAPSGSAVYGILSQFGPTAGNYGWFLGLVNGVLAFYYSTTGSDAPNFGVAFTPTLNTWYHVAADRDSSGVIRLYLNGAVQGSTTYTGALFASSYTCQIGNDHNNNRAFPGHLDEARITAGVARYGGAFTPPSAPFSPDAATTFAAATQVAVEHFFATSPQAQVTQVSVEHFFVPAAQAQVTQVALEEWGSANPAAQVTQVALEMWAPTGLAVVTPVPPPPTASGGGTTHGGGAGGAAQGALLQAAAQTGQGQAKDKGKDKNKGRWALEHEHHVRAQLLELGFYVRRKRPGRAAFGRVAVAQTGSATLSATGGLGASAAVRAAAGATLSGAGALGAAVAPATTGSALAGQGSLSAVAALSLPAGAAMAASGLLGASAAVLAAASANLAGVGSLSAVPGAETASAAFSGVGSLAALPTLILSASASFAGSGVLGAQLSAGGEGAGFAGQGALGAWARLIAGAQASFAGVGSLGASATVPAVVWPDSALLTGVGSLGVDLFVAQFDSAAFQGVGFLGVFGGVALAAGVSFNASGTLSATGSVSSPNTASFGGVGSMAATASVIASAGAALSGAVDLSSTGSLVAAAGSALAGQGAMIARGQAFKRGVYPRKTVIFGRLQLVDEMRGSVGHPALTAGRAQGPVSAGRSSAALLAGHNK